MKGEKGNDIVVDAYNVLITVESIPSGKEMVLGMDGFLRDISAVFSDNKFSDVSRSALEKVLRVIFSYKPQSVLFILDSQMSKSGELAGYIREEMIRYGLSGDTLTSRSADHEIKERNRITLTSDSAIIEKVDKAVDICSEIKKRLSTGDL